MSSPRVFRLMISTFLATSTVLLAYGCNSSEAASSRSGQASQGSQASQSNQANVANKAGSTGRAAEGSTVKAGAKVDDPRYTVELRPSGEYTNGKEGTFVVYLETKGDYHVNEDYPNKFTPAGGDGATYKGPVNKDSGSVERTKLTLNVPFTPTRTGNVTVAGKLAFGFCTDAQCEMGKLDLELSVAVK